MLRNLFSRGEGLVPTDEGCLGVGCSTSSKPLVGVKGARERCFLSPWLTGLRAVGKEEEEDRTLLVLLERVGTKIESDGSFDGSLDGLVVIGCVDEES